MTSQHTIHVDRRSDTDDVPIRARVDHLTTEHGPFAALHLHVGDDELALLVTRPTNALAIARELSRAVYALSGWAMDHLAEPDPAPVSSAPDADRVLAYGRAAS